MNEDVLDMIDTLHARLKDVQEVVEGLGCEAAGYAARLDKIDDEVYALQLDLEKLGASGDAAEVADAAFGDDAQQAAAADDVQPVAKEGGATASATGGSDGEKELLSDEMKENLKGAGRTAAEVLRDGKEVVSELTSTMNEFKEAFSFKPTKK